MKKRLIKETRLNNDFSNLLAVIVISLIPLVLHFLCKLFGDNELIYMPNILIYISDGFLIHNCLLIKREWKDNPPEFAKQKYEERARKHAEQINHRIMEQYKTLIEKCGIRFFIKYYKQIKCLPLRDVSVTENYSSAEREERLLAAKKIIEANLTEFTLNEIIKTYGDILDESEIKQAKSLLEEVQSSEQTAVSEK